MKHVESLASRVRTVVDMYWQGSVNKAAHDLGVPQSSLQRVIDGSIKEPRAKFLEAFRRGVDVSTEWLLGGIGEKPTFRDSLGRPIVAGVARWRRALHDLHINVEEDREIETIPYAVWQAGVVLTAKDEPLPEWLRDSLTYSLIAWSRVMETFQKSGASSLPIRTVHGSWFYRQDIMQRRDVLRRLTKTPFSNHAHDA